MSSAVLLRTAQQDLSGSQVRFLFDFDKAFSHEANTNIGRVFEFWRDCPKAQNGVRLAEPILQRRENLELATDYLTIISTSASDPKAFFVEKHSIRSSFENTAGKALGDIEWQMNRQSLFTEYLLAREMKEPMYDEIHQWRGAAHRHYSRIILPVSDKRGKVVKILVIVRVHKSNVVPLCSSLKAPLFG